ncbi:MAG: hypothetical protein ACD_35C00177G0004 [uncultured bacterium]|nr:MAG: hypothetical protein ACD_35C00177G0004 [uncultured bacterium]
MWLSTPLNSTNLPLNFLMLLYKPGLLQTRSPIPCSKWPQVHKTNHQLLPLPPVLLNKCPAPLKVWPGVPRNKACRLPKLPISLIKLVPPSVKLHKTQTPCLLTRLWLLKPLKKVPKQSKLPCQVCRPSNPRWEPPLQR